MRKMILIIVFLSFIFLITSCERPFGEKSPDPEPRQIPQFSNWHIPDTFVPSSLYVIGLGDSLTVGVGDELKKGGYLGRVTEAMHEWQGVKEVEVEVLAKTGRRSDQLLKQLEEAEIQRKIKNADVIFLTIGGNDIMKVIKRDLFNLKVEPFYKELTSFQHRLDEIFAIIRALNGDAMIIVGGLYNPFSIISSEPIELVEILSSWNEVIEVQAFLDPKSCFIQVDDLFYSNENLVYHTDFFHPNAKGYRQMTDRYIDRINTCNLLKLSDGALDM